MKGTASGNCRQKGLVLHYTLYDPFFPLHQIFWVHGLLIEQHGDVNTGAGRMVIRKKRERMSQRVL